MWATGKIQQRPMATLEQLLTSRELLARASVILAAQPLGALLANAKAFTLCFVRMTCIPALATSKRACLYGPHNKLQDMALAHCKEHISLTLNISHTMLKTAFWCCLHCYVRAWRTEQMREHPDTINTMCCQKLKVS